MKFTRGLLVLTGFGLYSISAGQYLNLPASECKLRWEGYKEVIETHELPRKRFVGCITFCSQLLAHFAANPSSDVPCALKLENQLDPETNILFWVYRNSGPYHFGAEEWNSQLGKLLETCPEGYAASVETPFKDNRDSGSPILGRVPLKAVISTIRVEDGKQFWTHLSLVPVKDTGRILVVELRSSGRHYSYLRREYESFLKGLFYEQ